MSNAYELNVKCKNQQETILAMTHFVVGAA